MTRPAARTSHVWGSDRGPASLSPPPPLPVPSLGAAAPRPPLRPEGPRPQTPPEGAPPTG
ncbi:hypothetical protein EJ357_30070 [Streptomyces cyaneochromogenes]|uniref:Uncharacterized protein n=1 Tax=Streptomyces cyaneochromogenes TaxID=2496836 RepID=A0A3S9MDD5_9ACTN|nr:hypothetical protein EJ357_30070 [Streptomyces cyaneochromogenes]